MRIFLCLLGQLNAWDGQRSQAVWNEWGEWSPCSAPCTELATGEQVRFRTCRNGEAGEGTCHGETYEIGTCHAECVGTCSTNLHYTNGDPVEIKLDRKPEEICFWSTPNTEDAAGLLVSHAWFRFERAMNDFSLQTHSDRHIFPATRAHSHTCIIIQSSAIHVVQDGFVRLFPFVRGADGLPIAGRWTGDPTTVTIGGGTFDGYVSELAATDQIQEKMIRLAQSTGSACNLNTIANLNDFTLAGAWSEWTTCSHNCNGQLYGTGRSYRYRESDEGETVQMYRKCALQPCPKGWTDWSQWTPCDASCGGGQSHRTRTCKGPIKCEGAPHETKPCNALACPQCGYSHWEFPAEQSITNYLMVKHVLHDFHAISICFSVENGLDTLDGTVFSYSRGLDSPRGNELLFLGKDISNDEIRLYRRDEKISIPNTVMTAGNKADFCITLGMEQGNLMTAIYVDGFITATSSEGTARNGVVLPGGGEMIIGQDQDCILGCFNSSQAFVGNLYNFQIFDTVLNPEEVMNLHLDNECPEKRPVMTLEKDSAMVYGKPEFKSTWSDFGAWSECSVECGEGYRQRERACLGGRPNDSGCPGSNIEKENCDTGVECEPKFDQGAEWSNWSECSVKCGSFGTKSRVSSNGETEELTCGDKPCPEIGEWSEWSSCSHTCGDGFVYRSRECYNGPCEEPVQETSWCNESVCVDSFNMPWACGEVKQEPAKTMRIVGGYEAQRGEVPWVCILELRSDPICGASVIAPKWNIGASHCVSQTFDRPEQMRVLCGVKDRTVVEPWMQVKQVQQYYKHPMYSGSTIDYDLCLFEMESAWEFTDYVKPICLPGLHQFPKPGTLCKVAGWGSTHPVAPGHFLWHVEMARSLRAVHVPIIEQAQCAAKYKDQITRRMFCAGYDEGGRDACQGDSGGPIACQIGSDNPPRWQLTGVVSWGIGCAQKNLPGVYTKLAMLTDWIYDYIGKDAGRDPACNVEPLTKSGPRGQFTSPLYDEGGSYGYNMNCHWIIALLPVKGLLAVTFTRFDLQYSRDCREDSLALYGGQNLDLFKGQWCGNSGPATAVSDNSQSAMKFVLSTNADNRGTTPTGFKAIWARARLKSQRSAGCGMPVEDFANFGEVRSVQSFSWPLTPPRNSPTTCIVVIRSKKNRQTKQLAVPGLFFEDDIDPFCARKMTFFRNSKTLSKFIVNYDELFTGGSVVHKRPIFQLLFDGRNGGDQCRWKLHYVGCSKNDAGCPDRFRQTVPRVLGHRAHNKSKALHCSGSMIGNDRTFVTSAECGAIVNHSWQTSREGTYCNVGGEEIITRHCKEHPKGGIAVCHLDAAVNPETVIVPCYPSSEITKDEMLAAESQSNLNMQMGSKSSAVQRTFLPTHAKLGGEVAVVNGLFSAGFSGAGQNLCNSESGTPIFRDTEDGSRELVGIVTSENSQKCQDKLAFASIIRHNEFIAQYATEFEPEANEFEKYEVPEEECENVGEHVFDENCTPITIKSPGYPELYGNNKKCQWTFAAPLKHLIKVELKDVDIESTAHPRKCLKDALVFSQKGKVPIQVCRSVYANKTIVSTPTKVLDREEASLTFSSDSTVTGRGFEATVSCLPKN